MSGCGAVDADNEMTWPAFVVSTLCSYSKLEYETWSGSSKYTSWPSIAPGYSIRDVFLRGLGIEFWLDLWLYNITDPSQFHGKNPVNCYDLAAICQVLVSLGVQNSTDNVRMKYMEPFGFIKAAELLGREEDPPNLNNPLNKCNNPFYRNTNFDSRMLCDDESESRSAFGNHLFLTIDTTICGVQRKSVLDACCGPHVGATLLKDYPAEAIDSNPRLYGRSDAYGCQKFPYRPGGLGDIIDGIGVTSFVTSRGFIRDGRSNGNSTALLDRLACEIEGKWKQLAVTTPAGNETVTATFEYQETSTNGYPFATVNIFRYNTPQGASDAFQRRRSALRGYEEIQHDQEVYSDHNAGGIRIFCNPGFWYLATVESVRVGAEALKKLSNKLREVLNSSLNGSSQPVDYFKSGWMDLPLPLRVGLRFPVKLRVSLPSIS